jgi:EmrB/QacA subfamily drug resistance transporter
MSIAPGSNNKWWVLVSIGIGTFMTALDTSVVNTVLPVVSKSLNVDVASVQWVVTIYLLVLSGLLLSFGRLGDMRGHKIVYVSGFVIFVFSSVLCGVAPNVVSLVGFRALQALGAAMLAANSPAILTKSFPASQRGQALGMQATMTYLGLTAGPSFGGWLAGLLGWRAVFYINLPVGLLAIWLSLRSIPADTLRKSDERFDVPGAIFFMVGLSALLLGLNQGHNLGWESPAILGLLTTAVVFIGVFIFIESRVPHPMLDLSLFRRIGFALPVLSAVLNYIGVYSVIFLMPFYLIQGRFLTPAQAGLLLTAQPIIMAIVAPISGTLSDRIGTRWLSTIGMIVLSCGLFLLSRLNAQSPNYYIILALGTVGLGTGVFISPNNSALMGSAPRERQGIAAGILATTRNFGMVLGVGLAGAIFTTVLVSGGKIGSSSDLSIIPSLFLAIQKGFLVAAGITVLGIITSFVRPLTDPVKAQ